MSVIKFILFLCSLIGYTSYVRTRTSISKYLVYIGIISFQVTFLYVASLLNLLTGAAWLLYILGFTLFLYTSKGSIRHIFEAIINNLHFVSLFMAIYVVLYCLALWNQTLVHYDNFTHWATIVKFLHLENRLPNINDTIISYNNYPIGSSLYLYYITKFVGFNDGILLIGQFIVIAAAQYAIFDTVKDKRRLLPNALIFAGIGVMTYLNFSIRYNNLLVDALIAALSVAAVSVLFEMKKENFLGSTVVVTLILNFLVMVKASALFFVICIILAYFVIGIKRQLFKESRKLSIYSLLTLLPIISNRIWSFHVKTTFGDSIIKKHEVHSGSITDVLQLQLTADQTKILQTYLDTVFSLKTLTSIQILLIYCLALGLLIFYGIKYKQWKSNLQIYLVCALVTFLYYAGNLVMYLTAMPVDEALRVAGFERYILTIILINLFIFIIQLVRQMDDVFYEKNYLKRNNRSYKSFRNKKLYELTTIAALMLFTGFIISDTNGMSEQMNTVLEEQRALNEITEEKHLESGNYLVVSANQEQVDNYFLQYYARYVLWNPHVDARYDFIVTDNEFETIIKQYDGVLLLDNHYTFVATMKKLTQRTLSPGYYPVEQFHFDN